jgi:very-short-patch-repair endonuclease
VTPPEVEVFAIQPRMLPNPRERRANGQRRGFCVPNRAEKRSIRGTEGTVIPSCSDSGMQLGLVSEEEALKDGLSIYAIARRVRAEKWQELHRGIYLPSPQKPTFHQRVLAGCVWSDGVASYRTAAALFGLLDSSLTELTTCRNVRSPYSDMLIHRVRSINARDITRIGPIPVTRPIRTILDLAGVLDGLSLRGVVYEAWQRELITLERLEKALYEPANGKPGVAELRKILEEGLDSYLERLLRRVLDKTPLHSYEAQYEVRNSKKEKFFIDFAYTDERVAVEADGWATHSDRAAFRHDRYKWRELGKLGWTVLCFTYEDIKFEPKEVIATIAAALEARRSA